MNLHRWFGRLGSRGISVVVAWGTVVCVGLAAHAVEPTGERVTSDDLAVLSADANVALNLAASQIVTVRFAQTAGATIQAAVPIGGEIRTLDLEPFSVPADDYKLVAQLADGSYVSVDPGPITTYRGRVVEIDGSAVAGSMDENGLRAVMLLPDGHRHWLEPIGRRVAGAAADQYVLYRDDDVLPSSGTCATIAAPPSDEEVPSESANTAAGGPLFISELAIDADVEYFHKYGTVQAVAAQINTVINTMNLQYERDLNIRHILAQIIVRTAEPDPFSSFDAGSLLNQLRDQWDTIDWDVHRDAVQLFTGKNLTGNIIGIAMTRTMCLIDAAYCLVESDSAGCPSLACKTDLSAHELGHVWSATHCSCPGWTMNATITSANRFHPVYDIPGMTAFRDSRTCLSFGNPCDPAGTWDCNHNGVADACDIVSGTSQDCNSNGVPDECDRSACTGSPGCADCNNNGILDVCDIASGAADCQPDGVPDVCELAGNDANTNGIPDDCEPPGNIVWDTDDLSTDRTTRSLRFRVEGKTDPLLKDAIRVELVELGHPNPRNAPATVALPTQTVPQNFATFDTNSNGVCRAALARPNYNGHPCNTNADCVSAGGLTDGFCVGNPLPPLVACTAPGESVPPDVSGQGGCARWVGKPATFLEAQENPTWGHYRAARLQCTPFYWDWVTETAGKVCAGPLGPTNTGLPCVDDSNCTAPATCKPKKITVVGAELLPSSTYSVRTYGSFCAGSDPALCSNLGTPATMFTRRHGDVAEPLIAPDAAGQPNGIDVAQIVQAFNKQGPLRKAGVKITPNLPEENLDVGADDVGRVVDAAKGFAYPPIESGPCPCPPTVSCGTPCGCDAGPACAACGGGQCVPTCVSGANDGEPCNNNTHCPGGTCGPGSCRDRCGRCRP